MDIPRSTSTRKIVAPSAATGALCAGFFAACALASNDAQQPAPPPVPGNVEWPLPAAAPVKPQTDEEKKLGQEVGRTLPVPELLQPTIDPDLPPYAPTPGLQIGGHFEAGSSDVLPSLVEAWVAAFRRYFPDFSLSLARPLAGSIGAREMIAGRLANARATATRCC